MNRRASSCSMLLVLMLTACTARDVGVAAPPANETGSAPAPSQAIARPAVNKPLELPVPIGSGPGPSTSQYVAEPAPTNAVVQDAIVKGMGPAASDVKVVVKDGMVYLTGSVANQADFQAANYIARALPGVDEVDQSALKVR